MNRTDALVSVAADAARSVPLKVPDVRRHPALPDELFLIVFANEEKRVRERVEAAGVEVLNGRGTSLIDGGRQILAMPVRCTDADRLMKILREQPTTERAQG